MKPCGAAWPRPTGFAAVHPRVIRVIEQIFRECGGDRADGFVREQRLGPGGVEGTVFTRGGGVKAQMAIGYGPDFCLTGVRWAPSVWPSIESVFTSTTESKRYAGAKKRSSPGYTSQ